MDLDPILEKEGPQKIIQKTDEKGAEHAKNNTLNRTGAQKYAQAQGNPYNRASEHRNKGTEKKHHGKKQGSVNPENRKDNKRAASLIERNKKKSHEKMLRDIRKFGDQLSRAFRVDRNCLDKKVREICRVEIKEIQGKADKSER